jgi:hypothetical protein
MVVFLLFNKIALLVNKKNAITDAKTNETVINSRKENLHFPHSLASDLRKRKESIESIYKDLE